MFTVHSKFLLQQETEAVKESQPVAFMFDLMVKIQKDQCKRNHPSSCRDHFYTRCLSEPKIWMNLVLINTQSFHKSYVSLLG